MPEVEIRFSVVADQAAEEEGNQRSEVGGRRSARLHYVDNQRLVGNQSQFATLKRRLLSR